MMLDGRGLSNIVRRPKSHRMAAPPAIIAVPFPQLSEACLAFLPLMPPAGHKIFGDLFGHRLTLCEKELSVGKYVRNSVVMLRGD